MRSLPPDVNHEDLWARSAAFYMHCVLKIRHNPSIKEWFRLIEIYDIYKLLNKTRSRIVKMVAASKLAQEFKIKNSTSSVYTVFLIRSAVMLIFGRNSGLILTLKNVLLI